MGAHSVGYLDSTVERSTVEVGTDLRDYYSEGGEAPPKAWITGRDSVRAAQVGELFQGITDGQELRPSQIDAWFNENTAPSGLKQGGALTERSVRGWDLTFAAPKSVSLLWGLSTDAGVQLTVEDVHQQAIRTALAYLSEHAGYTRVHNNDTGQKDLVQLATLSGVAYQHRTSRARDPHLHSHVLLHNRQVSVDGRWGSIDGTSLMHEAKAAGTIYQAVVRSELTRRLGVQWGAVDPATGMADVAGFSREAIEAWSQRHSEIEDWMAEHLETEGAAGSAVAQKDTRERKDVAGISTAELRAEWRADERVSLLPVSWGVEGVASEPITVDRVLAEVAKTKSTWTRADLVEVLTAMMPWEQEFHPEAVERAVDSILGRYCVNTSVDPDAQEPGQRAPHQREGSIRWTSEAILGQEQRLMADAAERIGYAVPDQVLAEVLPELELSDRQIDAAVELAGADRRVAVLVAPAGTGKTTTLRGVRQLVEADRGRRLLGVAPTGKAADVMASEGAVASARTVAATLQMAAGGRLDWRQGDVVVVDEAGMLGTDDLAQLLAATKASNARLLLVGDPAQLEPVRARGGALDLLAHHLPDVAHLEEVWRQIDPGEREASLAIRDGNPRQMGEAIGWYRDHHRLETGNVPAMLDGALNSWWDDHTAGKNSLMIAATKEWAAVLNRSAQYHLIHQGKLDGSGERRKLMDRHSYAVVGDVLVTRQNNHQLRANQTDQHGRTFDAGMVRNGQRWQVVRFDPDAALVRNLDNGAIAQLPNHYLAEHTQLGYATTVHAAQGITTDTTHALLDADRSSRTMAYVALTRGRHNNRIYLAEQRTGDTPEGHTNLPEQPERRYGTPDEAARNLADVLARTDRDITAHQVIAENRRDYLTGRSSSTWPTTAQQTPAGRADTQRETARTQNAPDYWSPTTQPSSDSLAQAQHHADHQPHNPADTSYQR